MKNNNYINKKKKGMSLVEIVIVLAISVVVLGTIYSLLTGTTKSRVSQEVTSTLQKEVADIQNEIVKIGTQCKKIVSIIDNNGVDRTNLEYSNLGSENKLSIKQVNMEFYDGSIYGLYLDGNTLKLINITSASTKILAKHVEKIYIRPLDLNTTTSTTPTLNTTNGLQFMVNLKMKKGYSNVVTDFNTTVKFRNKDI